MRIDIELPCSIFLSPYPSGNSFEHPRMYFLSVSVHSNRQPSLSISGFRANRGIQRLPWPPRLLWHPAPPMAFISQLSAQIERDLIHFSARIPLRLSAPSRTASTPLLSISRYPTIPPASRVLLRYSCASQGVSWHVSRPSKLSTLPKPKFSFSGRYLCALQDGFYAPSKDPRRNNCE